MNLNEAKRSVAARLLDAGDCYVFLDPRRHGVIVATHFVNNATLTLVFGGHNEYGLECDEVGIRATLAFGGRHSYCDVPWYAVHALVGEDGKGARFAPEPVPTPTGVRYVVSGTGQRLRVLDGGGETTPRARPALRVIKGGAPPTPTSGPPLSDMVA